MINFSVSKVLGCNRKGGGSVTILPRFSYITSYQFPHLLRDKSNLPHTL